MNLTKRKVSCTFKRENSLEIQERIYPLPPPNNLVFSFDHFLEVRGEVMPVEHIDAKGEIGFLESFFEMAEDIVIQLAGCDNCQIQVGVVLHSPAKARAEGADFALGDVLA